MHRELVDFLSCFFTFEAAGVEAQGPCAALYAFKVEGDARTFLVYDEDDAEGLSAAVLVDPAQVERAQAADDAGKLRETPVIDLVAIADDADWDLVNDIVAEVEDEED